MQGSKCVFAARQQSPLHMLWSVLTSIESNSAKVEEFRWQGNTALAQALIWKRIFSIPMVQVEEPMVSSRYQCFFTCETTSKLDSSSHWIQILFKIYCESEHPCTR